MFSGGCWYLKRLRQTCRVRKPPKTIDFPLISSKINGFPLISLSELTKCSRHAYRKAWGRLGDFGVQSIENIKLQHFIKSEVSKFSEI